MNNRLPSLLALAAALFLACAPLVHAGQAVASRSLPGAAHRKGPSSAPAAGVAGALPAPAQVLRSADGAWVAANVRMKQEGWGTLLLYENGQLVRALTGWQAVDFEQHGSRILIVQCVPDDDTWYALIDRAVAADSDMGEMGPRNVHRAGYWKYTGWIAPTVLEFTRSDDPTKVERVDLTTLH
jgi:hypothetical protein